MGRDEPRAELSFSSLLALMPDGRAALRSWALRSEHTPADPRRTSGQTSPHWVLPCGAMQYV